MRIEIGCGNRPTPGYLHQDVIQLETPLDFLCNAWELPVYENSIDEILAIAVMEHLRYDDFRKTLKHFYKILRPGGVFYFDVPDLFTWSEYLYNVLHGNHCPYSKEDVIKTMWGWQRWEGDEHKSMWTYSMLMKELVEFRVEDGFEDIKKCIQRDRFSHPENAHIFIKAIK
jgi:predicted SAM-dependent methyltransferase